MRSFSIQSFGCRVNQAEAFQWVDEFQRHGLRYEEDFHKSDLVLVNTCTLTAQTDCDVRRFVRKVVRDNPAAKLVVTGCYVDRTSGGFDDVPQIWQVLTNKEKQTLPKKVLPLIDANKKNSCSSFRSRALVKIQDGCDFSCTFCVVPGLRGKSVSFEKDVVIDRVKGLIDQGFREIVLTGIHICLYGQEFKPQSSLLDLLKCLEGLKGLGRIRLSSLDPRFMDHGMLEHIVSSRKICPHFHLSLQHGSNKIIRRMGRKILVSDYERILGFLREHSPEASIGADIITGFPGETDDDFDQTYRFLERSPLTYFHVFTYSPRPETAAANWEQVRQDVKKERARILRELSSRKNLAFRGQFKGKERYGVVVKNEKTKTQVLTDNYLEVLAPPSHQAEKEEVRIRISMVTLTQTLGHIVS